MRLGKNLSWVLAVFLLGAVALSASEQEDTKNLVAELLEVDPTADLVVSMFKEMVIEQRAEYPTIPAEVMKKAHPEPNSDLLLDRFKETYATHLTTEELRNVVQFYRSPTGVQLSQAVRALAGQHSKQQWVAGVLQQVADLTAASMKGSGIEGLAPLSNKMSAIYADLGPAVERWEMGHMRKSVEVIASEGYLHVPYNRAKQKRTIASIREIYAAIEAFRDAEGPGLTLELSEKTPEGNNGWTFRVDQKPKIHQMLPVTYDRLIDHLGPEFAASIPEQDGWGHAFQFAVGATGPDGAIEFAIRSPGADGVFDGEYLVGSFERDASDNDLVWVEGFFIRWPGS